MSALNTLALGVEAGPDGRLRLLSPGVGRLTDVPERGAAPTSCINGWRSTRIAIGLAVASSLAGLPSLYSVRYPGTMPI